MQSLEIAPAETGGELRPRLSALCAELLAATLPDILAGRLTPIPQDDRSATYAGKLDPDEAGIDWGLDAAILARQVCALAPKPGAWTTWRGERLKLHRAVALSEPGPAPGIAWRAGAAGIDVAAGAGSVRLLELQPPGGRTMSARDFLNGRAVLGERFGE